ncbi:MAG TPA: hypothetical protein VMI94_04780 [Bryobacteraceae bacterium]|nr:hypothetical protein [Bryobacteraceae bacterium]
MRKLQLIAANFIAALSIFPILCLAQNNSIQIVSGNGQLVCPSCEVGAKTYFPLVVQVNNSSGQPLAGATVTWTTTLPGYATQITTSTTGTNGQTSCPMPTGLTPPPVPNQCASPIMIPAFFFGTTNFLQATVSVSTPNATTASFSEWDALPSSLAPTPPISIVLVPQTAAPQLTGPSGGPAKSGPIVVKVITATGFETPLSGVAVSLSSSTASNQPSVSCQSAAGQQPGVVLTDSTGQASCTPIMGPTLGTGSYSIVVGGNPSFPSFGPTQFTVTAGPPALLKYSSGSPQTVNSGIQAPLPLNAKVTDLGGNPTAGGTVKWTVTAGVATLSSLVTTSPSTGIVSARVTPTVGPVTVTCTLTSNTAQVVNFTINVNIVATGLSITSGDQQEANENDPFTSPLIVTVVNNSAPVQGATVNFTVVSGSATLSAPSAVTNALGQAQVTATAGATPGPVMVSASVKSGSSSFAQTFNLTVNPPGPTVISINNAASFVSQSVSPCSLATIFATGLTPGFTGVAEAYIAPQYQVNNVTVQFGGMPAPILDVANTNGQQTVSVQVPCEISVPSSGSTTVQLVVSLNGVASPDFPVTVSQFSPGIFMTTQADGTQIPILVGLADGQLVSTQQPARRGNYYRMFVTGLGQTNPGLVTNEFDPLILQDGNWVPEPLPILASILVGVDNGGAPVTWAGYAYDMVGVYEIDFQVPENSHTGNNIAFAIIAYEGNNIVYGKGTAIPVQ